MDDKKNIQFEFAVGDRVSIAATASSGVVKAQWNDEGGPQYSVNYADKNGVIQSGYFRASEISLAA
jgi:hypothetical protein